MYTADSVDIHRFNVSLASALNSVIDERSSVHNSIDVGPAVWLKKVALDSRTRAKILDVSTPLSSNHKSNVMIELGH